MKVEELLLEMEQEGVLEDRLEYGKLDLAHAYPGLFFFEVELLYKMLRLCAHCETVQEAIDLVREVV